MKVLNKPNTLTAAVRTAVLAGACTLGTSAQALEFNRGEWLFNVDTTLGYSAQWRTENRDDGLEANVNGIVGNNNFDDGDMVDVDGQDVIPVGIKVGRGQGSNPVVHKDTLFITTTGDGDDGGGGGNDEEDFFAKKVNLPENRVTMESWNQR